MCRKCQIMLIGEIGELIKKRRKSLKITQPHLAQLARISTNTLYKIERGQNNPTLEIISKLVDILGMEMRIDLKRI